MQVSDGPYRCFYCHADRRLPDLIILILMSAIIFLYYLVVLVLSFHMSSYMAALVFIRSFLRTYVCYVHYLQVVVASQSFFRCYPSRTLPYLTLASWHGAAKLVKLDLALADRG